MLVRDHASLSLANLLRLEIRANPYPFYQRLRAEDPVHWDESRGFWALTRYADVVSVIHDPRFSKAQGLDATLNQLPDAERIEAAPVYHFFSKEMLHADPPYHTYLRGLINKAFTPHVVEQMRPRIEQIVNDLLDAVQVSGRFDVIRQFAFPLPATVILEMLGLPQQDCDRFKVWSDDFMAALGVVRRESGVMQKAQRSLTEVTEYMDSIYAELREHPRDDLLSALVRVEVQGRRLSRDELVANTLLVLSAGHETTTNLIGNGLLALLHHPDQLQKLRDDPLLISVAVEELLRYDNPVQIVYRVATENVDVGGKPIGKGQIVNLIIGAANRDPAQFADPERLDFTARDKRHMGFGLGSHFCLGAPLARLEGQIALNALLQRMPVLRLESEALEWQENPTFRGVKSLSVVF